MSYLEELLPEFRKGAKIRQKSWKKGAYIEKSYGIIRYHSIQVHELSILDSDWEFYQEPIDWDYIIKNKCPCWFWNKEESKRIGILTKIEKDTSLPFIKDIGRFNNIVGYKHCRPVSRDEVIFYEDL